MIEEEKIEEVIYVRKLIEIEKEYIEKQNLYFIEKDILSSFSKEDLKNFINETESSYLKISLPYISMQRKERLLLNYSELDEFNKYFVDMLYYFFDWGEEIEITKQFINKLNRFYKMNYEISIRNKKVIDIKTIPIREIISLYIKLPTNFRRNIKCIFPDHKDQTPSLKIYEKNNSFYCFWCHKWGNILNLISEMEQISTKEAYKKLLTLFW